MKFSELNVGDIFIDPEEPEGTQYMKIKLNRIHYAVSLNLGAKGYVCEMDDDPEVERVE